jgi:translation initiation factor 2B subunit (eIF-2B alpha/beta/delta family)
MTDIAQRLMIELPDDQHEKVIFDLCSAARIQVQYGRKTKKRGKIVASFHTAIEATAALKQLGTKAQRAHSKNFASTPTIVIRTLLRPHPRRAASAAAAKIAQVAVRDVTAMVQSAIEAAECAR